MSNLFQELKKRNVFKVAAVYCLVAWLVMQIAGEILPTFEAPLWINQVIILTLALGLPVALVLAWAFELTPEGIKTATEVTNEGIPETSGSGMNSVILGLMVLAVGFLFVDRYFFAPSDAGNNPQTANVADTNVLPNSIAVLPLANMSADPENAFFATGMHDVIVSELAKISGLSVISRTAVLRYADTQLPMQQIAEELKVQSVLEGSVQYANGQVRLTVQLIDSVTGAHIWSGSYDWEFKDVFYIQSDIAQRIAEALETQLLPSEIANINSLPTSSPEAYKLYLRSLSLPHPVPYPNTRNTHLSLINRAIELDPQFALAYERLASYAADTREAQEQKIVDINRALELEPDLAPALIQKGVWHQRFGDWDVARESFERAAAINPNHASMRSYSRHLMLSGQIDEAVKYGLIAHRVGLNADFLPYVMWGLGRLDEAARYGYETLEVVRDVVNYSRVAQIEAVRGNMELALEHFSRAEALWVSPPPWGLANLAMTAKLLGLPDKAQQFSERFFNTPESQLIGHFHRVVVMLATDRPAEAKELIEQYIDGNTDPLTMDEFPLYNVKHNIWNDAILNQAEFVTLRDQITFGPI